ncbi:MAG: hypothetical protein LH478_03930 [Chitinophagaceae bacterium]|nr:hypothetical protein [Chitinophagaceae bacterium]
MIRFYLAVTALFVSSSVICQQVPIPLMRQIFHDRIDQTQQSIDASDRKTDGAFTWGIDEEVNQQLTYSLFKQVDELQIKIEADSQLDINSKIKFLRGLNEILASFDNSFRYKGLKAIELPNLVNAYSEAIEFDKQGASIVSVIDNYEIEVGEIISKSYPFQNSPNKNEIYKLLVLKACRRDPDRILPILTSNPNISFADSLIKLVAYNNQEDLYTYAQSTNTPLGRRIQNLNDPLVKMISKLALINEGRLYFPFLDDLYKGKMTMEDVQKALKDDNKYYKLLVSTQIDYADRLRKRDTPMVMHTLTGMLKKKAMDLYINVINGLHESPDNIRMRVVEPLTPQELYYLCVMGENEIYTSSYLKVYDRIFQRMKNPGSDSLLMSVNFNYFKKFIKMAAGYNRLDDFLKRMSMENAQILMKAFANGLERTGNLEDAVDVADSYASISDEGLRKLILTEVQNSYNTLVKNADTRGANIYDIMNNIFLSIDSSNHINISEKYGIPPVYQVPSALLRDSSGRIIVQQFFYGDKDGNAVFNNFIGAYSNSNWKILSKPEWIEVSSTTGIPVTIYANKPLDSEKDLDAKAQASLGNYLEEKQIYPTVVIHRGHSYFVKYTIQQLAPSAKVVLLGSCGGYHNLHDVLEICPYAHIIASKQVGSGTVNQPMIVMLTDLLRQGKDLNWPAIWKEFNTRFKGNDLFNDYVPPHKNLGAIFIMAYNTLEQRSKS